MIRHPGLPTVLLSPVPLKLKFTAFGMSEAGKLVVHPHANNSKTRQANEISLSFFNTTAPSPPAFATVLPYSWFIP
jgi:hypothetical protein